MDTSKFNLWRACFSFCFVDGFLTAEEVAWIEEKLGTLKFNQDQWAVLLKDLNSPPNIDELLPLITSPADRGFLMNNIRLISLLDKELSEEEKSKIEVVKSSVMSRLNLTELETKIAEDEKASYHEDEVYKVYNKHSYVEAMVKGLMKRLNPGDYKYPDDK